MAGEIAIPIDQLKQKQHGPYQAYITRLLGTHPHLQVLERFVDEDDWENWRACGFSKDQGLTKFDVVVVDIERSPVCPVASSLRVSPRLESGEALTRYSQETYPQAPDSLRLFLVEDLSRNLIEYLGSRYKLDPNFFESHLRGHEKLLSGRPLPRYLHSVHPTPPTVSEACTASYFTAGFYRPYKFGDGGSSSWRIVQKIRWETENVIRHGVAYLKLQSTDALFLNERFSVIAIPAESLEGGSTGIVLFDPFLPLPPPRAMCGYRNTIPPPPFGSVGGYGAAHGTHRPLREDFLDWIKQLDPLDLRKRASSFRRGVELPIIEHLFLVAAANTINFLKEVEDAVEYIELKTHGFWRFNGYKLDEDVAADCIQMLRYFSMDIMECMRSTTSILKGRFRFKPQESYDMDISCERLISDFEDIYERLQDLKLRAETDINYFVARLSSKEAHRAQLQADELKWMNILLFMLGPISTLASILAIQERGRYGVIFLLCAFAALLFVVISRSWGYLCRKLPFLKAILHENGGGTTKFTDESPFDYMGTQDSAECNWLCRRQRNDERTTPTSLPTGGS